MSAMASQGMITGNREEVVIEQREDTEKMKVFQEKLEREKLEIQEQAKRETDAVKQQKNIA